MGISTTNTRNITSQPVWWDWTEKSVELTLQKMGLIINSGKLACVAFKRSFNQRERRKNQQEFDGGYVMGHSWFNQHYEVWAGFVQRYLERAIWLGNALIHPDFGIFFSHPNPNILEVAVSFIGKTARTHEVMAGWCGQLKSDRWKVVFCSGWTFISYIPEKHPFWKPHHSNAQSAICLAWNGHLWTCGNFFRMDGWCTLSFSLWKSDIAMKKQHV